MSEYVKEYFSSALDFAGEEQGDTYRKYCVIQLVGPLALGVIIFCMKLMIGLFGAGALIAFSLLSGIINIVGWGVLTFPNIAATVRRTRTLNRSKWWAVGIVFFPIPLVPIAWWVLGVDNIVKKW